MPIDFFKKNRSIEKPKNFNKAFLAKEKDIENLDYVIKEMDKTKSALKSQILSLESQTIGLSNNFKSSKKSLELLLSKINVSIEIKNRELHSINSSIDSKLKDSEEAIGNYNSERKDISKSIKEIIDSFISESDNLKNIRLEIVKSQKSLEKIEKEIIKKEIEKAKLLKSTEDKLDKRENKLAIREGDTSVKEKYLKEKKAHLKIVLKDVEKIVGRKINIKI